MKQEKFDEAAIKKSLKIYAKSLGIPSGAANAFIDQTLEKTKKSLQKKSIITDQDLSRILVKELKKFNTNLAYVYENRDKII